jgi:hypothetical protein
MEPLEPRTGDAAAQDGGRFRRSLWLYALAAALLVVLAVLFVLWDTPASYP